MNINFIFTLVLCVFWLAPCVVPAQRESAELEALLREAIKNTEDLDVFGRVIDQYGAAVPNARVYITWRERSIQPDPGHSQWVEADSNGEWKITIHKPDQAHVQDLEKKGYEFDRKTLKYLKSSNRVDFMRQTNEQNPLVLTMRKKGPQTFLYHSEGSINLALSDGAKRIDFFAEKEPPPFYQKSNKTNMWDMTVEAEYFEDKQAWNVVLTSTSEKIGGILVSDDPLYEAPEKGYQIKHEELVYTKGIEKKLILLVKSRDLPIYSRVDIEFSVAKDYCIMSYDTWSNPYGKRNLEYDTKYDVDWNLRRRLEKECKEKIPDGEKLDDEFADDIKGIKEKVPASDE